MFLLGCDIGSSLVKVSLIDVNRGSCIASAFAPPEEMPIHSPRSGWAEQDPEMWWQSLKQAIHNVLEQSSINPSGIKAIGIAYQMHGLVMVDKQHRVLRPSIIWCDSRAVPIGEKAYRELGQQRCFGHLLNSPGNFTASKLKWVRDIESGLYERIHKIMLPGDYIAMRLTGEIRTTVSGLSEGIFWDFKENRVADFLIDYYDLKTGLLPDIVGSFAMQGNLSTEVARELGLVSGTPVTYRAGDQPNNALSLNVLNPGEVAATAGTSGVVYRVSDTIHYDTASGLNTFAHVNHSAGNIRLGLLLCINGTGIQNSWIRRNLFPKGISYEEMNRMASSVPAGSAGITALPFGNGTERMFGNREVGSGFFGVNFNIHTSAHLVRAAHEGIAFSFNYGMNMMKETGMDTQIVRASHTNMFLSPVFRQTLADLSGSTIELYDTDGSQGAARGAGIGLGIYPSVNDAFSNLKKVKAIEPSGKETEQVTEAYQLWLRILNTIISVNQ